MAVEEDSTAWVVGKAVLVVTLVVTESLAL